MLMRTSAARQLGGGATIARRGFAGDAAALRRTPLWQLNKDLGATMVEFGGTSAGHHMADVCQLGEDIQKAQPVGDHLDLVEWYRPWVNNQRFLRRD